MSFCGECGTENPDTNSFCKNCGKALRNSQAAAPGTPSAATPRAPAVQQAAPPPAQQAAQPVPAAKEPMPAGKKFAIGSIIFGIIAFLYMPYLAAVIGIVLGALAVRNKAAVAGAAGIIICVAAVIIDNLMLVLLAP